MASRFRSYPHLGREGPCRTSATCSGRSKASTPPPAQTGSRSRLGDGRTFTIDVDSSTTYDYPSSVCSTDNFSCLATQQVVKVEVSLQTDGTLLASEVNYVQPAGQMTVEGNIIRLSTSGGNTLMDLILQQGPDASNTLLFGRRVTVTVPASGVTYAIDSGTFTIPGGLSFASASDLIVGQEVSVVVQGSVATPNVSGSSSPWAGPGRDHFHHQQHNA